MENSSDPFWEQDLSNIDIKSLIIRILRFKPEWIYQICKNPQKLIEEYGFREVFRIHKFFENANVIKFIMEKSNRLPLKNFISKFLLDTRIYIDENKIISEEIKAINKITYNSLRLYNKLSPNEYIYKDSYGNTLELIFHVKLKDYIQILEFYCIIIITCNKYHQNSFYISKSRLIENIMEDIGYRAFCDDCYKEFLLPPNLSCLIDTSYNDKFVKNKFFSQMTKFINLSSKYEIPTPFSQELYSHSEEDISEVPKDIQYEVSSDNKISSLAKERYYNKEIDVIEYKETINFSLKYSRLYQQEYVYFHDINLNSLKFKNVIYEILRGLYNFESLLEKIKSFEEFREKEILFNKVDITEFLFKLTRIAGKFLPFTNYCNLLNYFAEWDNSYAINFSETAKKMFKNMILKYGRSGINFPINTTKNLRDYLCLFNEIINIKSVHQKEIISFAIDDWSEGNISNKNVRHILKKILELYNSTNEKIEIYLFTGNAFIEKGYTKEANYYFRKAKNIKSHQGNFS